MTRSALQAMDVIVQLLLGEKVYKGREFEGGRVKNRTGWEAVGFIFGSFLMLFVHVVSEGVFYGPQW